MSAARRARPEHEEIEMMMNTTLDQLRGLQLMAWQRDCRTSSPAPA